MSYSFSLGSHGDIVLTTPERKANLGYTGIFIIPSVCWAYGWEVAQTNMMHRHSLVNLSTGRRDPEESRDQWREVETILEEIPALCSSRADQQAQFNRILSVRPFAPLSSGLHDGSYTFQINQQKKLDLLARSREGEEPETILSLTPAQASDFGETYIHFILREENMGAYHKPLRKLIQRLKEY